MMKITASTLALGLALLSVSATAQTRTVPLPPLLQLAGEELTQLVEKEMANQRIPGSAMSVVINGVTVYSHGFGFANLANHQPATPETLFHLASISKTITAISVMQLASQGMISLDHPLVEYLPWFQLDADPRVWRTITVRQLLSHTSGIARDIGVDYWMNLPRQRALQIPDSNENRMGMTRQEQVFAPGTHLKYSNMGFWLLGELVAERGGAPGVTPEQRYINYVTRHVLAPLGMGDSGYVLRPDQRGHMALPYGMVRPITGDRAVFPLLPHSGGNVPAWGLISSVAQMESYVKFLLAVARGANNPILDPSVFRTMIVPVMEDEMLKGQGYGLGFMTQMFPDGSQRFFHSGSYPGYKSYLSLDPALNMGVIFLSNATDTNREAFVNLAYQVYGHALAGHPFNLHPMSPPSRPAPIPHATGPTANIMGTYSDTNQLFTISEGPSADVLTVTMGGVGFPLAYEGARDRILSFRISPHGPYIGLTGERLQVEVGADGRPLCAVVLNAYRWMPVSFGTPTGEPSRLCGRIEAP